MSLGGSWLPRGFEFLSGLPEAARKRRLMLALQAFFDESGGKGVGKWMTLAGLFGTADVFASVADRWDRALRAKHPGPIRYFKMKEATGLSGEFAHWRPEARDEKLWQMAEVMNRPDLLEIASIVGLDECAGVEASWVHVGQRHTLNQPYLALFQNVLVSCVAEAKDIGYQKRIELVLR